MVYWLAAAGALLWPQTLLAQKSHVTCPPSFDWARNDQGQDPCLVAALVQAHCRNDTTTTAPLAPNQVYIGPDHENTNDICLCNSAVYSLLSVCAACQDRPFIDWPSWMKHCAIAYVANFPKSVFGDIRVPPWALDSMPQSSCTRFDLDTAERVAILGIPPPSSGTILSMPTLSRSGLPTHDPTPASTPSPPLDSLTANDPAAATATAGDDAPGSEGASVHKAVTIGAAVGAVAAAAAIILCIYFCVRRFRKKKRIRTASQSDIYQKLLDVKIPDDLPYRRVRTQDSSTFVSSSAETDITNRPVAQSQASQGQSQISLPSSLLHASPVQDTYSPAAQSSGFFGRYSESNFENGYSRFSGHPGSVHPNLVPNRALRGDTLRSLPLRPSTIHEEPPVGMGRYSTT